MARFGLIGGPDLMHEVRTMLFASDGAAPARAKDALKLEHPSVRSQHSCEAIAAGLGFRTYNGLCTALKAAVADWDPVPNISGTISRRIDDDAFRVRIQTLCGIDIPPGAFLEAVLRTCPAMVCGEDVHERILVGIADGLSANYYRKILGSRYEPSVGAFEFIRFSHDPDCPVTWNNGVATHVVFHNTGLKLLSARILPEPKSNTQICVDDRDTLLLYRREIAAMSRLAREVETAIAGDLTRLPGCGQVFEMSWGKRYVVDVEAPCCEAKRRAK